MASGEPLGHCWRPARRFCCALEPAGQLAAVAERFPGCGDLGAFKLRNVVGDLEGALIELCRLEVASVSCALVPPLSATRATSQACPRRGGW